MKNTLTQATLFLLCLPFTANAQPVSTKAPKDYATVIAPLLTPIEKVSLDDKAPEAAEHGWILLDENIQHIRPNGSRLIAHHQICRAISDSGVEALAREVTGYRLSSQTPHLLLARSIQPDGRRQDVRPDARFLQTPQREADADLYNDSGELVIIFPNVKPGTLIEFITVIDDAKPRIPNHFTTYLGFEYGWPVRTLRQIVDLPADYASRLKLTPLGNGVPEASKESLPKGRTRWTWLKENSIRVDWERNAAPFTQSGPLVRLTTLKDWSQFLDWYVPLAERSTKLGPKLEAEVTRWTADSKSLRETLDILHTHVANDIRYVGLEFGDSDLEPHPVSDVWEHQYGDCKDKASLLRAMLRFKGITAHLVLVNTSHLGRVERRSPDYRDFNHAILVADLPEGPVFCDPTIEKSVPALISPNDADRDVLVVTKPERWMRTPTQEAGSYSVHYDAKLSALGEISGWATLEADGYLGIYYQNREARSTRQQLKETFKNIIESHYSGASVIDLKSEPRAVGQPYRLRAYFIVPPAGAPSLRFPFDVDFISDFGDGIKRRSDAFMWRETDASKSTFELPAGLRPVSLPSRFVVSNDHMQASAVWALNGRKITAEISVQLKSSRLPASDVKAHASSLSALRAWLDKAITLEASDDSPSPQPATEDVLTDFPRMPTGEGQLELVAERYPTNGNMKLRRAAYEKTIEFFPQDKLTQFSAITQLAFVDVSESAPAAAITRLRSILDTSKGAIPLEDTALAEYVLALALRDQKQPTDALAVLDRLASNKEITTFRRAWSHIVRSQILEEKEPEKALQAARDGLALEDADIGGLLVRVCFLRAQLKQEDGLRSDLTAYLAKDSPQTKQSMLRIATRVNDLAAEKPAETALLTKTLTALAPDSRFGPEFDEQLAAAQVRIKAQGTYKDIQSQLKAWLTAHPADVPVFTIPDTLKTPEDFTRAIDKALARGDNDSAELTRLAVESLIRFEPSSWFGERLWKAATYIDLVDINQRPKVSPPLLLHLLDLCDATPAGSDPNSEGRFLRALMVQRRGRLDEAAHILQSLMDLKELDDGYRITAIDRFADNAVDLNKPEEALTSYRRLQPYTKYYGVPTHLLKATLLALETGDEKSAFHFLGILRGISDSIIAKSPAVENIRSILALDDAAMRDWWQHSAKWWPLWLELEKKHFPASPSLFIPIIPKLADYGAGLRRQSEAGQHDGVLTDVRRIAHAARWQPVMAMELVSLLSLHFPAINKIITPYRQLTIAIHEAGGLPKDENGDRIELWASIAHIDGGDPLKGLAIAKAAYQRIGSKNPIGIIMLRLWAAAAAKSGQDLDNAARALETDLAKNTPDDERYRTVSGLASIYQKQNQRDKELALLKAELENPITQRAVNALQPLRERYDLLLEGGGAGDGPTLAAKAWLAAAKPAWFDHIRPTDLKDEKAADPDNAMRPGSSLTIPEAAKLCYFVSIDTNQPDESRYNAVSYLAWYSIQLTPDMKQLVSWVGALKNEKNLPKHTRAFIVWLAVRKAYWDDLHTPLQHFMADPTLANLRGDLQSELKAVRQYGNIDPTDLNGTHQLATEILKGTLDYIAIESLQRCIHRLAHAGRFDEARQHYQAMAKARYTEESVRDKSSRQLTALKAINNAKKLHPVHVAMRDWFLACPLTKDPTAKPVPEPYDPSRMLDMPDAERLQLYRQWITAETWPRDDLSFWIDLGSVFPRINSTADLPLALYTLLLEKAPDDETRAQLIFSGPSLVDTDDPPTLQKLEAILKPWRNRTDIPSTQDALRAHDLRMKLRIGQEVDLFAALSTMQTPPCQSRARHAILSALISRGDKAGTRRLIEQMNADQLLSRSFISDSIQAYRLLGMADEAELAADQLRQIINEEMLGAWLNPHGDSATPLLHLARQLDDPSLIPQAFSDYITASLRDPHEKYFFLCFDARLRKKWEDCAKAAREGVRLFPTIYNFYEHLGIASAELGQKEEAIRALTTFTQFDHNTPQATAARQRLEALKK